MLANKKQIAQSLTRQQVEATQTTTLPGVLERGATVVHFALIRHTTHISMPRTEINGTIIIVRHHACMHEQVSRQANAAALDSRNTLDQNDHIQTKEAIRKIFPRLTFVTVGDGSEKKWDPRTKRAGSIDVFYNNTNML